MNSRMSFGFSKLMKPGLLGGSKAAVSGVEEGKAVVVKAAEAEKVESLEDSVADAAFGEVDEVKVEAEVMR